MARAPCITHWLVAAVLATSSGCGERELPNHDLSLSITAEASEVELGRAFPLTVVRVWGTLLTPRTFDERALAPLVTRLESTSVVDKGSRIEETRRYVAYAFTPGSVTIPAVPFAARNDSADWPPATSEPLRLRVRSSLDPKSPGVPEEPGPMLQRPRPWLPWAISGAILATVALLVWRRRRSAGNRTPVPPPVPADPGPDVEALARLASLRARGGAGADIVEASDVVRTYAARRFAVRAGEMTSQELVASLSLAATSGATLRELMSSADCMKFAAHRSTGDERTRALDNAEAFVLATRIAP